MEANRLERLVIDLETGQRGFIITGEERFLEPWRDAQVALPTEASTLERLVADSPQQEARAQRLGPGHRLISAGLFHPAGGWSQAHLTSARSVAATSEGGQRINAIRSEFDRFVGSERELAAARERRQMQRRDGRLPPRWPVLRIDPADRRVRLVSESSDRRSGPPGSGDGRSARER